MPDPGYAKVRRAIKRRELERSTWAQPIQVVVSYDTLGVGELTTDPIMFGTVYEGPPFFSYGVELAEGETLVDGDFPFVTCGVQAWITGEEVSDVRPVPYIGAVVWIRVASSTRYQMRFRLSFEGMAFRNTEYLRGDRG